LKKEEQGIKIYTRINSGSSLKEVRAVDTVRSSLSAIVALLLDAKNYSSWIYACKEASTLKRISETEMMEYQLVKVPFPFENRDMIFNLSVRQDASTRAVTVKAVVQPDFISAKDGIERIRSYRHQYILTPLNSGRVLVEFEMYVDPGGNIPNSILNAFITKGPFNTALSMREQLKKKEYQSAVYSFIKENK